jgi:putative ABC transport system ATP-binding protein
MSAVDAQAPSARLRQVSLAYAGPVPVRALDHVDLTVERGEYLSVTGRSGSGKSSLLALLGALRRPTGGTIELCGLVRPSGRQMTWLRRRSIAFVFQDFQLLRHLSALDNVVLGDRYSGERRRHRRRRALDLLEQVGLADRRHHRPQELSGGEQQRVAIARALMRRPALLLADEPVGNLDSSTSQHVLALLEGLRGPQTTLVIVTHAGEIAERAGRVIRLLDGRLTMEAA